MNGDQLHKFLAESLTEDSISKSTDKKESLTRQQKKRQLLRPPPMPVLQVDTEENTKRLEVSHHGHMELNSPIGSQNKMSSNNETSEAADRKKLSLCNMCNRNDNICVNVQNKHGIVLTVSDLTRLPSWNIREILASMCPRCLVYINALTESSSKLRLQCEQAMHHQTVELAPPTPDTSPATPFLDDTPAQLANNLHQRNRYAPGYCEDTVINDVPTLPTATSPPHLLESRTFAPVSRSPTPTNGGNNSMLQIHHERPVSPLTTESGGGKNNKRSYQRVSVIPMQMICTHCNRAYWRKDFYAKHMRRCSAKSRYAKSLGGSVSMSRSRLDLMDAVSVISEGNDCISTTRKRPVFRCNECSVTVESLVKIKEHKKIHLQRYYCNICSRELSTQNEYDFHYAECSAKSEVFEKGMNDILNKVDTPQPGRRKTRSLSRACSLAPSKAESTKTNKTALAPTKAQSTKTNRTTVVQKAKPPIKSILKKSARQQKKAQQQKIDDTPSQQKPDDTPSQQKPDDASSQQKPDDTPPQQKPDLILQQKQHDDVQSTISNFLKNNRELYTNVASDDSENDDDDDAVSEVDTLYSKRLSLTNHWVEEHSHSSQSHLSQDDNYMDDYIEDIPFKSVKEYDLYLLDRLKVEVKQCSLTCFAPDCRFTTTTLTDMMIHDYISHFKKSWFYCHKCGHCFTSKVFLDYHLDLQNKGRYVCYKCGGPFEYQHQLDRHFIQHARQLENISQSYTCHYCNYEFLDEDKLFKHCDEENHSWNTERPCIEIDHSMTIVNKVPPQHNKTRRSCDYKVRILNMVLRNVPSKRCTPLERYRPYLPQHLQNPYIQHRIGHVEFRDPINPNCVGCL